MTHADARANMDIAQASAEIASATGKDSSAMKTIATMTMAFLPATFFAALFAVPSLKWDESSVIQDKFWVYWAFTIPCTAAVFLVQMYLSGGFHMK
jgi:Mg2+ and Co2+ transporter CorA